VTVHQGIALPPFEAFSNKPVDEVSAVSTRFDSIGFSANTSPLAQINNDENHISHVRLWCKTIA
jgi:hypothetical protein